MYKYTQKLFYKNKFTNIFSIYILCFMQDAVTTEHTVPYIWKGKICRRFIKRHKTKYESFIFISTKKSEYRFNSLTCNGKSLCHD